MSFFFAIPVTIILLLLIFLFTVWLRKVQYDSIHRNLLTIEDKFGGKVVRKNFLYRPFYSGEIENREIRVGFTSEKYKNKRAFYFHFTLSCKSKIQASIISREWYEGRDEKSKKDMKSLLDGKYWIQSKQKTSAKFIANLEKRCKKMPEFAYILVADTGLILERVSENLISDAELEFNEQTIKILLKVASLFEKPM